jgi:hypothetical protein
MFASLEIQIRSLLAAFSQNKNFRKKKNSFRPHRGMDNGRDKFHISDPIFKLIRVS